jgi:dihydrofolate reductase
MSLYRTIIVAADLNNAIGVNGDLPWKLPNDLKFFKNTTWAFPVIMGRKTFESFNKPLIGRTNIVLTNNSDWQYDGVEKVTSLPEAWTVAEKMKTKEVFLIGGGNLYQQGLADCNRVYLTRVHTKVEHADTWFPALDQDQWKLVWERYFESDAKHAFPYSFQCWERVG